MMDKEESIYNSYSVYATGIRYTNYEKMSDLYTHELAKETLETLDARLPKHKWTGSDYKTQERRWAKSIKENSKIRVSFWRRIAKDTRRVFAGLDATTYAELWFATVLGLVEGFNGVEAVDAMRAHFGTRKMLDLLEDGVPFRTVFEAYQSGMDADLLNSLFAIA